MSAPKPFYWSVRRELWEHRSIYIAPAAAACLVLIVAVGGLVFGSDRFLGSLHTATGLATAKTVDRVLFPYDLIALAAFVSAYVVGSFYCLGALYGERRDRSILFWKSLPVSDATAVLAKASVVLLVLPIVVFVVVFVLQAALLLIETAVAAIGGVDPGVLWARLNLGFLWPAIGYGVVVMTLWQAPVYAWILMVSAWAKRMVFLWAIAPVIADWIVESIASGKLNPHAFLWRRVASAAPEAFTIKGAGTAVVQSMADLHPLRMAADPQIWGGALVAALFLFIAIRLRRSRDPI